MDIFYKPWPWYVAGPMIGLTVPLLLWLGNKKLGISSTLRQICAACIPGNVPLFNYDWKRDSWNLLFAVGILLGGYLGGVVLNDHGPVQLSADTLKWIFDHGLQSPKGYLPAELFNWPALLSVKGFILMIVGGFMVGFGTRYAGGCTSGHGIMGLSALQWPSLVATASFFLGGILFSYLILPYVLAL
jgi:uncharacterized membrane protein YedE/YeeE